MKKGIQLLVEAFILYFSRENPLFNRKKKLEPSLIAINIDWFTNCNWREQLSSFKQMDLYYDYKH